MLTERENMEICWNHEEPAMTVRFSWMDLTGPDWSGSWIKKTRC